MKNSMFFMLFFSFQGVIAQYGCSLTDITALNVLEYPTIFEGDSVTFIASGGGVDSLGWYALYYDHCCEWQIGKNTSGVFRIQVSATDIFIARIESVCDTTIGRSIELDVYPRVTGIQPLPTSPDPHPEGEGAEPYDLLGRKISGEHHGFYIIKKRLFFK